MKRRQFLSAIAALSVMPVAAVAEGKRYSPGMVIDALKNGETVFLDFKASWCSTCARQERVISELRAENPEYDEKITFFNIDWDMYSDADLAKSLRIPRRSTLVVLKGDIEHGRIVAETGKSEIKLLLDTALAAATSI